MDDLARLSRGERRVFIEETASRRDLTPIIIEKVFWVCWTLRRLTMTPDLAGHITFKGGTSLSKAYGIIQRFSEDIDLTIRRMAPLLEKIGSPMEAGISGNERQRRTKAVKAAAQEYVGTIAMTALARAVEAELGTSEGWSMELDPNKDLQTLLFNYPRTSGYGNTYDAADGGEEGAGYIKPRIKLEFGARGDPDPFEKRDIRPYVSEAFPDALPNALTSVETLSVGRSFWEKATILHALHHNGKLRDGLSRHYYDLLMLDRAGVTAAAMAEPDLLEQVVRNKTIMFADASVSYATAVLGALRLSPSTEIREALAVDYAAMADMFMADPPAFAELLSGLADLETRINQPPQRIEPGAAPTIATPLAGPSGCRPLSGHRAGGLRRCPRWQRSEFPLSVAAPRRLPVLLRHTATGLKPCCAPMICGPLNRPECRCASRARKKGSEHEIRFFDAVPFDAAAPDAWSCRAWRGLDRAASAGSCQQLWREPRLAVQDVD